MAAEATRIDVCADADLAEGCSAKFRLGRGKPAREGFVVRYRGALHAWRNECRHVPVTLDWVENRFFSSDGCWIQCATHGALYDPATGLAVAGPPAGKHLHRLDVQVEDGRIVVHVLRGQDA